LTPRNTVGVTYIQQVFPTRGIPGDLEPEEMGWQSSHNTAAAAVRSDSLAHEHNGSEDG